MTKEKDFTARLARMAVSPRTPVAPRALVEEANEAMERLPAERGQDGRTRRRTGRDQFFGTNIKPELHDWLKVTAAKGKMPMGRLLELMRDAYEREQEHESKRKTK